MKEAKLTISLDATPLESFIELFMRSLEIIKRPLDLGDFPSEPVRFECDPGPAGTQQLLVRLYPSDRFLDFAATVFARDFNIGVIEKSGHNGLQVKHC